MKNRRFTSIFNISDILLDVRLIDSDSRRIRSREESNGFLFYRFFYDEYILRGFKVKLDNDDIFNLLRISFRNSRLLKDNSFFDESYILLVSRKRDVSLLFMFRKDFSFLDFRLLLIG